MKLGDWDFGDAELNGRGPLVDRQKSAVNLVVLAFDPSIPEAVFFDPKRNERHGATLGFCNCHDFSFVGKTPRRSAQPCMHIYRLAMELGLLEAKYQDHDQREALRRARVSALKAEESQRLQELPHAQEAWGGWNPDVHRSGLQLNRQYRAYFIVDDEPGDVHREQGEWLIHDYRLTLDRCECADFQERGLPCKHIYAAALNSLIPLVLTRAEYLAARNKGKQIVFVIDEALR